MTPACQRFLRLVERDATERAQLVEALRTAADLLARSDDGPDFDHATLTRVAAEVARTLLDAASQLCDHSRLSGRRCRYCRRAIEVQP